MTVEEQSVAGSSAFTRRRLIAGGIAGAGVLAGAVALPGTASAVGATSTPDSHPPYPIPWLDPNLHHNQVPMAGGPATELSHIYHFKGQVGRALFTGSGTTNDGTTLYIGKGTDFGFSVGTYLSANGDAFQAAFAHI